jgi:hypothetical protein
MRVINVAIFAVVLLSFCITAKAQQNYTLYNMSSISQSIYCNPSAFPVNNINVGIPFVSSNYFGLTNTAFRYSDLVYKRPDDSLTLDVNKAISKMTLTSQPPKNLREYSIIVKVS